MAKVVCDGCGRQVKSPERLNECQECFDDLCPSKCWPAHFDGEQPRCVNKPLTVDFTLYDLEVEVDFKCTQAVPPFALNGPVRLCSRCDRRGVYTLGTGGRHFYIHTLTIDLTRPATEWDTDTCMIEVANPAALGLGYGPAWGEPAVYNPRTASMESAVPPVLPRITMSGTKHRPQDRCGCGCRFDGHEPDGGPCKGNGTFHTIEAYYCRGYRPEQRAAKKET